MALKTRLTNDLVGIAAASKGAVVFKDDLS